MKRLNRQASEVANSLLSVRELTKKYYSATGQLKEVLKGVSFDVQANEMIGIIGASGAGKSTIGKILANLEKADEGSIWYEGRDLLRLHARQRREIGKSISMVFQDPYESLSSRMKIKNIVAEPLHIRKTKLTAAEIELKVNEALQDVSLAPERYANRYPHELSGGERQRVGLARAFITNPTLLIADEPTSMLDSSLRIELLDCMSRMQLKYGTAILFITHDLALTYHFCDRLIVIDEGRIVEEGITQDVIDSPNHPFTQSLVEALLVFHQ